MSEQASERAGGISCVPASVCQPSYASLWTVSRITNLGPLAAWRGLADENERERERAEDFFGGWGLGVECGVW